MPDADLAQRVRMLEETLRSLRDLPDDVRDLKLDVRDLKRRTTGVEVQVLQLRTEMRAEFSALRSEMATKQELADGLAAVRLEMATKKDLADLTNELREDIAGMGRDLAEGQNQLRVMLEDVRSIVQIRSERNPSQS